MVQKVAPVFLVGPARSGTTLLYKVLCLHPQVAYVSNWIRRFPVLPELSVLNRPLRGFPAARRSVWFRDGANAYVYGTPRSLIQRLCPMPVEGEPLYRRCGITDRPGGTAPGRSADLARLCRTFQTIQRTGGGRVLVLKRIANNLRIPLLVKAFPEARFVFLIRDGRAVAYSLSRVDWWPDSEVWWYGGTPRQWAAEGRDPWELCARNWVEELRETERGLLSVPAEQRLDVRYEDFVSAPRRVLHTISSMAGLPPDRRWLAEIERLRFPDRNETWRRALDPEVAERISAVQRDDLVRLGYQGRP